MRRQRNDVGGGRWRWGGILYGVLLALSFSIARARESSGAPVFPGATTTYKSWIAAHLPGNAEGLAIDSTGTMYAGLWETGGIVSIDKEGNSHLIATVPNQDMGSAGMTVGLEFGPDGYLYAAFMWHYSAAEEADPHHPACHNSKDVYTGIYRIDVHTGTVKPFLTKKDGWPGCFPDDIAFDRKGNMYVTDLTLSGIWRIAPDGAYTLWSVDPLLQWAPDPFNASPEGANDLVISNDGNSLYVVTDGNPGIVKVSINPDGSAAPATWVARNLDVTDGVAIDPDGNIYVSEIFRDEISVFSPDGSQRIVIASPETAPLANPTSLIYRDGVLCVANMGLGLVVKRNPRNVTCISGFRRPERRVAN